MFELFLAAAMLGPAAAADPCDLTCERQATVQLLESGDTRPAIDRLRAAVKRFPEDKGLVLLLARAYLLEGNLFWAERTLSTALTRWPGDAEVVAWLAAVHLRQGDPELTTHDLAEVEGDPGGPASMRLHLLEASRARLAGDRVATEQAFAEVGRTATLYPEDRPLWSSLETYVDPWAAKPISLSADLTLGRTSNALAGAPTDPGTSGEASPLAEIEVRSRLAPPLSGVLRPVLDLEITGNYLHDDAYRDLSSLQAGGRVGAMWLTGGHRLTFGYRSEVLYLDQNEARYSTAHRGELEVEMENGWVIFAGGGRRSYRDDRRTRWEGDAGFGASLPLSRRLSTVAGATLRLADAESPAYDQRGLSAAFAARLPFSRGFAARFAASASWDYYPHSGGAEGALIFGTEKRRRDLMLRATATLWAPQWHGLRPGLELRFTDRNSTADATQGFDFAYSEWRIAALLRWNFTTDPWAPPTAAAPDHVPLDWGLEGATSMDEERILDLLRRDEELRRGSSCALP